ncbi:MAG: extracellular solute-binding protein [Chloroflexi bacterium]|nr:extracellular solute-binding protein [Chloroflexota bacterium]
MEAKHLNRRGFLRAAGVAAAGVAVAACQPAVVEVEKVVKETVVVEKEVMKEAPAGKPIIRFTTDWYGGTRGALTNQFLAKWKDEINPDVVIAYEPCPRVQDRLRVDFAAGSPPDVMLFAPELYASFGDQLLVLDDFWADADPAWKDDTLGWDPSFYFNGKLVAVPFQHNIWSPGINVDLFQQAGVPMPWEYDHDGDKWWNWEDFAQSAIAISKLGDDIYGTEVDGSSYMVWGPWIRCNGGEYVRPPWPQYGENVVSALDEPEAVEALTFLYDVVCTHQCAIRPDQVQAMRETLQVSPFYAGKVGITRSVGEGSIIRAEGLNAHRVVMPRPVGKKKSDNHQGNCPHVAWEKTQYPQACWDFMVFLDSTWAQTEIGVQGGAMPGVKSALLNPKYYSEFPPIAREALLVGANENTCLPGAFVNFEEWRKDVEAIAMDMLLCKMSAAEAIQEMHQTANMVLAKRA